MRDLGCWQADVECAARLYRPLGTADELEGLNRETPLEGVRN
jgi:hypothetical protein